MVTKKKAATQEVAKNQYSFESKFKVGDSLKFKGKPYEVTSISFEYFKDNDIKVTLSIISLENNHIDKVLENDTEVEKIEE